MGRRSSELTSQGGVVVALRYLSRRSIALSTSSILLLVIGALSPAAHAQNYGYGYGAGMNPAYQDFRPYTSPYSTPHTYHFQNQNAMASRPIPQTAPGYYGQPVGYNSFAPAPTPSYESYEPYSTYASGANYGGNCACESCDCDSCGCDTCCSPCCPSWGVTVGGLWFTREDENHHFFSYDDALESFQLLDSQDSNFNDGFGPEIRLSHFDCCCCVGCEVVYWGLYPNDSYAYAYATQVGGNLNSILDLTQLDYNGGPYGLSAQAQRLRRENEIHNVELNRLWQMSRGRGNSLWDFQALAGFRFFRFVDNLEFATDPTDTVFDGAADELYYTIDVDNNLYGLQFGGLAERQCYQRSRWSLTCGAKVGAFVNDAEAHSVIGGSAGVATINNGPNNGAVWDITSDKTDLAMLAELQAGLAYRVCTNWRLRAEYRILGITGVALPTNQIYPDVRGIQDVQLLSNNGDLVLHGGFLGLQWGY